MSGVAHARNLIGPLLTGFYRLRITGVHHLPPHGGVLLVSDQHGLLDPTILATGLTRPVRVLTHASDSAPRWSGLTAALGRIEVEPDHSVWPALQLGVKALRAGEAAGVFISSPFGAPAVTPPAALAAYLHARSQVPILAVTLFATSGSRPTDLPRPRSVIECHIAPPVDLPVPDDPVSLMLLRQHAERIRQICADARELATDRTGRKLPWAQPHSGHPGAQPHNGHRD